MPDVKRRFRYTAAFQLDNSCQQPTESVPYETTNLVVELRNTHMCDATEADSSNTV